MSIPREIIWSNQSQELEDSLQIEDGQLGELDTCTMDFFSLFIGGYTGDVISALNAFGYQKNQRVQGFIGSNVGVFFVSSFQTKREGSFAIVTINMIGQAGITNINAWQERRLREISAYGQMVSVGPIEKVIIVEEETEGIDPETGSPAVVKRRVPKVDALGEVEYQDIVVTGSGTSKRWNINDPAITVTDTYFVITQPLTNVIGTALTPPTPPLPPPYKWTGYNEPLRGNAPSGWVLDDRRISVIIPNRIWRVVDTHNFYQAAVPD